MLERITIIVGYNSFGIQAECVEGAMLHYMLMVMIPVKILDNDCDSFYLSHNENQMIARASIMKWQTS